MNYSQKHINFQKQKVILNMFQNYFFVLKWFYLHTISIAFNYK